MRDDVLLTYRCDGQDASGGKCLERAVVWEEDGKWCTRDLADRAVLYPSTELRGLGLPTPMNWTTMYGSHFCSCHKLTILPAEIAGEVPDLGKPEEFVTVGGLATLEKP